MKVIELGDVAGQLRSQVNFNDQNPIQVAPTRKRVSGVVDGESSTGIKHFKEAFMHKFHMIPENAGANSSGSSGNINKSKHSHTDNKIGELVHDVVEVVANLERLESNYNYGAHRISLNSLVNSVVIKEAEKQCNHSHHGSHGRHSHGSHHGSHGRHSHGSHAIKEPHVSSLDPSIQSSSGKKQSVKKMTIHHLESINSDKND